MPVRLLSRRAVCASVTLFPIVARAAEPQLRDRLRDLHAAAAQEGQVVFYTDGRQDAAQRLSAFWKANFPDVRLLITPISSPALIAQVETERAAGQHKVDVTHMSQVPVASGWKAAGVYLPYRATTMERFRPDNADADGAFYSPELYTLPAAYNTRRLPNRADLPQAVRDFLQPAWKGKLVLPDPQSSGNTLTFLQTMLARQAIDWPYLEALARQDVLFVRSNPDAVRMVASGERWATPVLSSFNILEARNKGQAIDSFALREGLLVVRSAMGVMAGAPHPNAAKLLIEAMLSPEGQAVIAEGGAFWPADPSVPLPAGVAPVADLRPITPPAPRPDDPQTTAAFLARFRQVFGRR